MSGFYKMTIVGKYQMSMHYIDQMIVIVGFWTSDYVYFTSDNRA